MMSFTPESTQANLAVANAGPSGLTPEHKAALTQATEMISRGHCHDDAIAHLVSHGMPRIVAKVLVKQLDKHC